MSGLPPPGWAAATDYSFDPAGRLQTLSHDLAGTALLGLGPDSDQQPTPHQDWLTVFPTDGSVSCR